MSALIISLSHLCDYFYFLFYLLLYIIYYLLFQLLLFILLLLLHLLIDKKSLLTHIVKSVVTGYTPFHLRIHFCVKL